MSGNTARAVGLSHPLVAQVNAEFEAAGDCWAALQQRPLVRKRYQREFEAIVREHQDNLQVLLREAGGYLDHAVEAALRQGYAEAKAEQDQGATAVSGPGEQRATDPGKE